MLLLTLSSSHYYSPIEQRPPTWSVLFSLLQCNLQMNDDSFDCQYEAGNQIQTLLLCDLPVLESVAELDSISIFVSSRITSKTYRVLTKLKHSCLHPLLALFQRKKTWLTHTVYKKMKEEENTDSLYPTAGDREVSWSRHRTPWDPSTLDTVAGENTNIYYVVTVVFFSPFVWCLVFY